MKKRGKWLTAMGLAMLLTLQTPVAAVVEAWWNTTGNDCGKPEGDKRGSR